MDNLKDAFQKVKQDILLLGNEIQQIKLNLIDIQSELKLFSSFIEDLKIKQLESNQTETPTHTSYTHSARHITPTHPETPTHNLPSQALKSPFSAYSTGNDGVPTDRQTDRQTDTHVIQHINPSINSPLISQKSSKNTIDSLEKAKEILDSLDSLKKDIRRKFKALTSQEMAVFSMLYQLDNQGELVDYALLASNLQLSEGSIRDYIYKMTKKGIPIIKEKLNNKKIFLHISQDLKKIASLDTILKLREI